MYVYVSGIKCHFTSSNFVYGPGVASCKSPINYIQYEQILLQYEQIRSNN